MTIKDQVKRVMIDRGISISDVGRGTRISRVSINKWLNGGGSMRDINIERVVGYLDMELLLVMKRGEL